MRLMLPLGTLHALAGVRPVRLAIALMVSPELTTTQYEPVLPVVVVTPLPDSRRLTMAMTAA